MTTTTKHPSPEQPIVRTNLEQDDVAAQTPAVATCPQCNTTTPWKASSWCPDCGYYPGITDVIPNYGQPVEEEEVAEEHVEQQPMLPTWMANTLALTATILVASMLGRYYFTFYGGDRSLVAFLAMTVGILLTCGAQLKTTFAAMQKEPNLTPFNAIATPVEVWRPTLLGLPATGSRICAAVCGITLTFSAIVIIGGIDFESIFERDESLKEPEPQLGIMKRMVSGAAAMAPPPRPDDEQPESLEEALYELAPIVEELQAGALNLAPSPLEPLRCVIYGFMPEGRKIGRVLLLANIAGDRQHVTDLEVADLPDNIRENLTRKLPEMTVELPAVRTRFRGIWVVPSIAMRVNFDGWSTQGTLLNPQLATDDGGYGP